MQHGVARHREHPPFGDHGMRPHRTSEPRAPRDRQRRLGRRALDAPIVGRVLLVAPRDLARRAGERRRGRRRDGGRRSPWPSRSQSARSWRLPSRSRWVWRSPSRSARRSGGRRGRLRCGGRARGGRGPRASRARNRRDRRGGGRRSPRRHPPARRLATSSAGVVGIGAENAGARTVIRPGAVAQSFPRARSPRGRAHTRARHVPGRSPATVTVRRTRARGRSDG